MGHGGSQEDVAGQRSEVAQHLQNGPSPHLCHQADCGLSERRVDCAVSDLRTEARRQSRGVRRRRARIVGKQLCFQFRDLLSR